ncbi:MAG: hypothetical protein BGO67_03770 [Alphaproteobacteria bacterium 41-28]|nr:MAG: hypothetical protein BGO67_03770 [Alphaproteobacteria bacterium 41-28]
MNSLNLTYHGMRRARVKSLIQVGSLVEKSGLLKTFDLPVGRDFQKDGELKMQISALYKGFLVLNNIANSDEAHLQLWGHQGLAALAETKKAEKEMSG